MAAGRQRMRVRAWAAGLIGLATLVLLGLAGHPATAQTGERPAPGSAEVGRVLYEASCSTCHGTDGRGVGDWPGIRDAGAASADFQLRTGRMPFSQSLGEQALRKPPAYDEQEIRDLVAYVASLGDGPPIPAVTVDDRLLSRGFDVFTSNCAPCHGATGRGGAVGGGAIAWALTGVDPVTVAEAMLTGPGEMPVFDLPPEDLDAVVTYVEYLRTAPAPGGLEIGGIGPVPEGFVAWLAGMGTLAIVVVLVGRSWTKTRP